MILKTLKSNRQINLIIYPAIALLFWLKSLFSPGAYDFFPGENKNLLFEPVFKLLHDYILLQEIVSLALVIILATLMLIVSDGFSFIRIRTKLPASLFIIIVAGFTQLQTLHPVYPAAIFLMFAIYNLFSTFEKKDPYSNLFNAGFFVATGSLFYINMIILLPAFLIGISILNRERNWRSFIIMVLGFVVPLALAFSYSFLTDQTSEALFVIKKNIFTQVNHFRSNIPLHGLLTFLVLLTLTGSIKLIQQYDTKKVSTRKYFSIFFLIFVFSMLSFAFIPGTSQEMLVIAAIPVTYLISNLLVFMKSRFWGEFIFILLLGIVIFMQFSEKFFWNG